MKTSVWAVNCTPGADIAWARIAAAAIATRQRALIFRARMLLRTLFDTGDLTDAPLAPIFGTAARALLRFAWDSTPPLPLAIEAIRFVGKSFASDPAASRALLAQILCEPRFSAHADQEAPGLAEQIRPITRADSSFMVEIYAALFGQNIDDDSKTLVGGMTSQITPLISTRRQDFQHCRWHLGQAMGDVLDLSPEDGTRAVNAAVIGTAITAGYSTQAKVHQLGLGTMPLVLRGPEIEFERADDTPGQDSDPLAHYVAFLRRCRVDAFTQSVTAAAGDESAAPVWARILRVGAERIDDIAIRDLLWPLLVAPGLFEHLCTRRDAVKFVAAAWPSRTAQQRRDFEAMALDETRLTTEEDRQSWRRILGRLLLLLPEDQLIGEDMRALRRELAATDGLLLNEPLGRIWTSYSEVGNYLHDELRAAGVDLNTGLNAEIVAAIDALNARLQQAGDDSDATMLAGLWAAVAALVAKLDVHGVGLQADVAHAAWDRIAHVTEHIAACTVYVPGTDGQPSPAG